MHLVKTHTKNVLLLPLLIASFGLMPVAPLRAQTFTTLHDFTGGGYDSSGSYTNSDGADLVAGLVLFINVLYGTTEYGGIWGSGTVFALHTDGTGFTNLHSFTYTDGFGANNDGANPHAGLVLFGNALYGTTEYGGNSGTGTVFKVKTDGTGFTNLHSFGGSDGASPRAGLMISSNTLYGSTSKGGGSGNGTVFAINTDGTGFTNLHSFTAGSYDSSFAYTNADGVGPTASLVLSSNILYGTTPGGGSSGIGTVFSLHIDGSGFTNLYNFTAIDGANPYPGLVLSGKILYGTAARGGSLGSGMLFGINTDGTGFTNLHNFAGFPSEGASPYAGLILFGSSLYGATIAGGGSGDGTVFKVSTSGTGFSTLHSFDISGAVPFGSLVLSDNTLYGTTYDSGNSDNGTVFSLSFRPQLTIISSGRNVILRWPTNNAGFDYTGFTLQSTMALVPPAVWTNVSPGPVIVDGQNTVTNPITGARKFYRLSQ